MWLMEQTRYPVVMERDTEQTYEESNIPVIRGRCVVQKDSAYRSLLNVGYELMAECDTWEDVMRTDPAHAIELGLQGLGPLGAANDEDLLRMKQGLADGDEAIMQQVRDLCYTVETKSAPVEHPKEGPVANAIARELASKLPYPAENTINPPNPPADGRIETPFSGHASLGNIDKPNTPFNSKVDTRSEAIRIQAEGDQRPPAGEINLLETAATKNFGQPVPAKNQPPMAKAAGSGPPAVGDPPLAPKAGTPLDERKSNDSAAANPGKTDETDLRGADGGGVEKAAVVKPTTVSIPAAPAMSQPVAAPAAAEATTPKP